MLYNYLNYKFSHIVYKCKLCRYYLLSCDCYLLLKGNYDSYVKTRAEIEENQMKQYAREQDQIKHMKVSVACN